MLRVAHCLGEPNRGMSRAQQLRSVTTSRRLRARMPRRRSGKRRCGRCGRTHSTDEYDTLRELRQTRGGKTAAPGSMYRTGGHNCLKSPCSREITSRRQQMPASRRSELPLDAAPLIATSEWKCRRSRTTARSANPDSRRKRRNRGPLMTARNLRQTAAAAPWSSRGKPMSTRVRRSSGRARRGEPVAAMFCNNYTSDVAYLSPRARD